jgi:hypothetical protein
MPETLTGGCQCGRIRYAVLVDDDTADLCHCRMCQRATGGVFAAWKSVAREALTWTTIEPERFRSSAIACRGFCRMCGTPLTFEYAQGSDEVDVSVGSFDDPYRFRPAKQFAVECRHEEWVDTRGLPGIRTDENPNTRDRWITAVGKLPD